MGYKDPRERSRLEELNGWTGINENYFIEQAYSRGSTAGLSFGEDYFFALNNEQDFLRAFNVCSPLKSIIGKRSSAFNTGKRKVVKADDRETRVNNKPTKDLEKLLKKPNILQNESQYMAQQNTYIDIFGYCPVIRMSPSAMPWEVTQIWNIPPWLFDIDYTRKWLAQAKVSGIYESYWMTWEGKRTEIDFKNLFFVFDDGIGTQTDTNLTIPDSRLVGLDYDVCNIVAAMKSRNTLITKRGAVGILSNEAKDKVGVIPMGPDEKEDLQRDFKKYGIVGQPYQIIITDAALKWQQIGFSTKDLMLFEEVEDSVNSLCDAYRWLPQLMSRGKASQLNGNDRKEAQKQVYRDSIIPESQSRLEQLMAGIAASDNGVTYGDLVIIADFSEVEVLQEDKKLMAEIADLNSKTFMLLYQQGLVTKNMWLIKMGMEPNLADPTFDDYHTPPVVDEGVQVEEKSDNGKGKVVKRMFKEKVKEDPKEKE